jgi:hypothetical protein
LLRRTDSGCRIKTDGAVTDGASPKQEEIDKERFFQAAEDSEKQPFRHTSHPLCKPQAVLA